MGAIQKCRAHILLTPTLLRLSPLSTTSRKEGELQVFSFFLTLFLIAKERVDPAKRRSGESSARQCELPPSLEWLQFKNVAQI